MSKGVLHPECRPIFRVDKDEGSAGNPLRLHRHQEEAIRTAESDNKYVLTTGTGCGKSLSYILPIVDYVLRNRERQSPLASYSLNCSRKT